MIGWVKRLFCNHEWTKTPFWYADNTGYVMVCPKCGAKLTMKQVEDRVF